MRPISQSGARIFVRGENVAAGVVHVAAKAAGDSLVCMAAADILARYSKGRQRIPLEQIGISPLNRVISGKHVHTLGRRIMSVEGFCIWRYRAGFCHEWDPHDPLAVASFTNRAARRDPLLAPVPEVPLYGSFAKSHLLSFLQALKSKSVRWSDSGDIMVPDEAQLVLMDHLRNGMFYEVLSYEAIKDDREAVLGLIAADNFDAGFALGQTEIMLLRSISEALKIARPPPGCSQFDVVCNSVERSAGQRWSKDDLAGMFNFAKVVGETHMEFLHDFVLGFVDQDVMAVKPSCFAAAAKIAHQAPWVKVALICTQYMSQDTCLEKGLGGKSFGVQVTKKQWQKFQAFSAAELLKLEGFLSAIFAKYRALSNTSEETLGRELPAFFVRVGKRCLMAEAVEKISEDFGKLEAKLREQLPVAALPTPVVDCAIADAVRPSEDKSRKGNVIVPDSGPTLAFEGDNLVCNMHSEARDAGFCIGGGVSCSRSVRGVKKGTFGVVVGFADAGISVHWDGFDDSLDMTLRDIELRDDSQSSAAGAAVQRVDVQSI